MAFTVAHKSASNKIRKTRGREEKKPVRRKGGGRRGRKGDRKRNQEMNLFMDGAGSSGDGRASGSINAKLAIHTKSAWVQVKRGEYISPGINLFELGLHWNNWTLQRAMISECSCGRRERERDGKEKEVDISTFRRRRGPARGRATTRRDGEIKEGRRWREMRKVKRGKEGKMSRLARTTSTDAVCRPTCKCNSRETYATTCGRHP